MKVGLSTWVVVMLLVIGMTGCTTTKSVYEVSDAFVVTYDQYTICRRAWAHAGVRWIEIRSRSHDISSIQMKAEMRLNRCTIRKGDTFT